MKLTDENGGEKWGCWDGNSDIVSVVEPSKDGAIEVYANDYLREELETETETRNFSAEVSLGRPVLVENHAPDFEDFIEHIEQSASDNDGMEDELIVMSKEERAIAAEAYERMISQFCKDYLKQREWNVFYNSETITIKMVNGEYSGWSREP